MMRFAKKVWGAVWGGPSLHVADVVTLGNALCGTLAIFFAASGQFDNAVRLIALAFFFDALDGPIARMRGPTESGELLDRVSDRISQAFAPAVIVAGLVMWHPAAIGMGVFVVIVALMRLMRKDADPTNPITYGVTLGPIGVSVIIGYWFGVPAFALVGLIGFIAVLNLTKIPIHIPQSVRKPNAREGFVKTCIPIALRGGPFLAFAVLPVPLNLIVGLIVLGGLILYSTKSMISKEKKQ